MVRELDENDIMLGIFLRDKPAKILLGLKTNQGPVYATILSKEADCTYSHTIKILNVLRDLGVVEFEKKGRIKRVTLTEEGMDLAVHMEKMVQKLFKLKMPRKPSKGRKSEKKAKK